MLCGQKSLIVLFFFCSQISSKLRHYCFIIIFKFGIVIYENVHVIYEKDYVSHLFIGGKINARDTQLYLKNVGIELTNKENEELLNILPLDGKQFRHSSEFGRILGLRVRYIKFWRYDCLMSLKIEMGDMSNRTCKSLFLFIPLFNQ